MLKLFMWMLKGKYRNYSIESIRTEENRGHRKKTCVWDLGTSCRTESSDLDVQNSFATMKIVKILRQAAQRSY